MLTEALGAGGRAGVCGVGAHLDSRVCGQLGKTVRNQVKKGNRGQREDGSECWVAHLDLILRALQSRCKNSKRM